MDEKSVSKDLKLGEEGGIITMYHNFVEFDHFYDNEKLITINLFGPLSVAKWHKLQLPSKPSTTLQWNMKNWIYLHKHKRR